MLIALVTPILVEAMLSVDGLDYASPSYSGVARECEPSAPKASISGNDPTYPGHKQPGRRTSSGMFVRPLGRL